MYQYKHEPTRCRFCNRVLLTTQGDMFYRRECLRCFRERAARNDIADHDVRMRNWVYWRDRRKVEEPSPAQENAVRCLEDANSEEV